MFYIYDKIVPRTPVIRQNKNVTIQNSTALPTEIRAHVLAFLAASIAPAWSPLNHKESTLFELTIATMPKGQQQQIVDRIDHTNILSGIWSCC